MGCAFESSAGTLIARAATLFCEARGPLKPIRRLRLKKVNDWSRTLGVARVVAQNIDFARLFSYIDCVMLEEVGNGPGATRRPFFVSLVRKNSRMRSQANMTLITPEERISQTAELVAVA